MHLALTENTITLQRNKTTRKLQIIVSLRDLKKTLRLSNQEATCQQMRLKYNTYQKLLQ